METQTTVQAPDGQHNKLSSIFGGFFCLTMSGLFSFPPTSPLHINYVSSLMFFIYFFCGIPAKMYISLGMSSLCLLFGSFSRLVVLSYYGVFIFYLPYFIMIL